MRPSTVSGLSQANESYKVIWPVRIYSNQTDMRNVRLRKAQNRDLRKDKVSILSRPDARRLTDDQNENCRQRKGNRHDDVCRCS